MNTAIQEWTSTEQRALALLGDGVAPEKAAASLGVSVSRISQLLSEEKFAAAVAELRYNNLSAHNVRDKKLDALEDTVIAKLTEAVDMCHRPMELTRILQTVNGAKRRGASTPESIIESQQIVSLVMPTQIIQKFQVNIQNQVTSAGEQSLLTMQSSALADKLKAMSGGNTDGHHEYPKVPVTINAGSSATETKTAIAG